MAIIRVIFSVGSEHAFGEENLPQCVSKPVSAGVGGWKPKEKEEILQYHNFLRENVLKGAVPGLPKAKVMKTLVWDEQLEKDAQR